jgi:hypothetical protein
MAKITPRNASDREVVSVRTKAKQDSNGSYKWWKEETKAMRGAKLVETAAFLKEQLQFRYRQASIYSRLYANMPLFGMAGTSLNRLSQNNQLPLDRPTMNVVQSCVDTLVSRITQSRPRPVFLTDNGDYKARNLAKKLNQFVMGEFYRTKAYDAGTAALRDAAVLGTGCLKIFEGQDTKVQIERVLFTELLVDPNDSLYGDPRQMYQLKLVDREVLIEMFPDKKNDILRTEQAFPDTAGDSARTASDQVMVIEGWHLPSGPDADDGKHIIACTNVCLLDEEYNKQKFPFVFVHYSQRLLGFFGQSLAEQLMGTQVEINKLLMTISRSINLVGVPRVFVEDGSKVVKAQLNNDVGSIVTYRGTKPVYEVAPCVPAEVYAQLQRLVDYAYQQSGISALSAASKKPAGLDSGAALREYDDLQSDRFATLSKRYDNFYVELAYQVIDLAKDIAERDGKYTTVYPNKNGTREVNLPDADLLEDTYIIQCFDASSLPRDPAGRMQKIIEMIQSGMVDIKEGRRMLDFPDLEQEEKLANSGEERILYVLDKIIEDGDYTPPDPFMDLNLAIQLSNQYYNLYMPTKLEEDRSEMLRTFNAQCIALQQAAQPPMPAAPAGPAQQLANPEPLPTSPLIPQT